MRYRYDYVNFKGEKSLSKTMMTNRRVNFLTFLATLTAIFLLSFTYLNHIHNEKKEISEHDSKSFKNFMVKLDTFSVIFKFERFLKFYKPLKGRRNTT